MSEGICLYVSIVGLELFVYLCPYMLKECTKSTKRTPPTLVDTTINPAAAASRMAMQKDSVREQFKSTHNALARPLPNAVFHHLIEPFLFRNPGEQRWPMLLSEVQDSQIKGEKALPSLQGGMDAPCKS